jgi:hypothetical protein
MPNDRPASPRAIPVLDIGRRGALGLCEAAPAEAAALVAGALAGHPLLRLGARLGDAVSRRWLQRRANPYLREIAAVAAAIGVPGVYLLNLIYEWACSTSAGPDPTAPGNRLIRVLDWGLPGIGKHVVIGRHESDCGIYFSATWPGYAGVLTAMAPGRFAAAINQAPRQVPVGLRWLDEVVVHLAMLRTPGTIPAAHLLRRVFEEAPDFATAAAMLSDERVALAAPALFTLSGTAAEESCVIEAIGTRRMLNTAAPQDGGIIGVANAWLSPGLPGLARDNAAAAAGESADENSRARRLAVCRLQSGRFGGAGDLAPPVLNGHTVLVASANARQGTMRVEALDGGDERDELPRVVGEVGIGLVQAAASFSLA